MSNTPLEDQVSDALHRRVDPMQHRPLVLTDVRRRARRVQRRRTTAAGAAVAAALAVAVPVGLAMNGTTPRTDVPPADRTAQTPMAVGTVRIDPRTADVGEGPRVPVIDMTGSTMALGDEVVDLPQAYDQITPYRDGWIASLDLVDSRATDILDSSFVVVTGFADTSELAVSADRTRVAWAAHDGERWSVINNEVTGEEPEQRTTLPPGPVASAVGTIGFVSADEVLAFELDQVDGSITTFLAVDGEVVELPWIDEAASASPVTGMIAGRTIVDDGRSCAATFDGRSRAEEPLWTDCGRSLGDFNPDGSLVVAIPNGDQASDGPRPGVSILDATTGSTVVDFEVTGARQRVVGIADAVWEDEQALLATYVDGNQLYVVRLGLDGTVERVAGPVTDDDFTVPLRLTPGVASP